MYKSDQEWLEDLDRERGDGCNRRGMDCKIGAIKSIKDGRVEVRVERHSACSGCHARGVCSSADRKEETIEIREYPIGLQVGDQVRILPSAQTKPLKAVLYAFVFPLILLLSEAILLSSLGTEETTLLLIMLGTLLLYALLLRGMRSYFETTFRLKIEPLPKHFTSPNAGAEPCTASQGVASQDEKEYIKKK